MSEPTCTVIVDGSRCGLPFAVPIVGMCIHEHIETALACPLCRDAALNCDACYRRGCFGCHMHWQFENVTEHAVE